MAEREARFAQVESRLDALEHTLGQAWAVPPGPPRASAEPGRGITRPETVGGRGTPRMTRQTIPVGRILMIPIGRIAFSGCA